MPNHIPLQNAGNNQIYEWLELDRTQSIKGQQSHHLDICGVESVEVDCFSMISFVAWFKKIVHHSSVTERIRLLFLRRPSIRLSHFDQDNVTSSCLLKVFNDLGLSFVIQRYSSDGAANKQLPKQRKAGLWNRRYLFGWFLAILNILMRIDIT